MVIKLIEIDEGDKAKLFANMGAEDARKAGAAPTFDLPVMSNAEFTLGGEATPEAAEREAARAVAREAELCSVAGCDSPRAYGRTCWRHVVRFDRPLLAPRPSAIASVHAWVLR